MTRQMLLKNVYLTYLPSEKFKTSLLSAQLAIPLDRETASLSALLVNVLGRGTARCPDMAALSRHLDLLYGAQLEPAVRKKGETQLFGFVSSFVDERFLPPGTRLLEPMADLMGDLFCHPATRSGRLDSEYVYSERENLADLIRADVNDKRTYAELRLIDEMCAGEPYGARRLGRAGDVEKIFPQRLNRFYREVVASAPLELFYCGAAPLERVRGALERAFSGLPRKNPRPLVPTTRHAAPEHPKTVIEEMDVAQGKLCAGFRAESNDGAANMLLNVLFGGGGSSRLFTHVRERLSLCYYADSVYHRAKSIVTVSAGIETEQFQRTMDEIQTQLETLRRGEWESWELDSARRCLLSDIRSVEDSAGALEDFAMGQAATGAGETLPDLARELEAVSEERLRAAAQALRLDTVYFLRGREEQP